MKVLAFRRMLLLLGGCMEITACGGGSGGSTAGGGTSPAPTPTATNTPVATGSIIQPTNSSAMVSATMILTTGPGITNQTTAQTSGGSTSDRDTAETSQFHIGYDSQAGYKLTDSTNVATFGPSQMISSNSAANAYANTVGSTEDYLALYKDELTSPNVPRRLSGFGGWQHTMLLNPATRRTRLDYFAYGTPTPASSMPKSGTARYFFVGGGGNFARDNDLFFSKSTGNLTVDFAAGTISCSLAITGTNFYRDESGGLTGFSLGGTISGNAVENSLSSSVSVFSGRFRLQFVGPNAEEVILSYYGQANGSSGYALAGSSVAVRLPS